MPLEKKSGLFYEILIRGAHGADPERKLGEISGAHYIEGEAVVDTDSGEVVQYKPGPAQELPADKVSAYLGDRFVAFEGQLRDLQKQLADTTAAAGDATAAATTAASAAAAEAATALAGKDALIAARDARIAELEGAQAGLISRIQASQAALAGAPNG